MKNLFTLIFLLFAINNFITQEIPINYINRINNVNFIFKGKVINSKPYFANNGRYIYTSNTVEITKILKGDLNTCLRNRFFPM